MVDRFVLFLLDGICESTSVGVFMAALRSEQKVVEMLAPCVFRTLVDGLFQPNNRNSLCIVFDRLFYTFSYISYFDILPSLFV